MLRKKKHYVGVIDDPKYWRNVFIQITKRQQECEKNQQFLKAKNKDQQFRPNTLT